MSCSVCQTVEARYLCGLCEAIPYCGVSCQKLDLMHICGENKKRPRDESAMEALRSGTGDFEENFLRLNEDQRLEIYLEGGTNVEFMYKHLTPLQRVEYEERQPDHEPNDPVTYRSLEELKAEDDYMYLMVDYIKYGFSIDGLNRIVRHNGKNPLTNYAFTTAQVQLIKQRGEARINFHLDRLYNADDAYALYVLRQYYNADVDWNFVNFNALNANYVVDSFSRLQDVRDLRAFNTNFARYIETNNHFWYYALRKWRADLPLPDEKLAEFGLSILYEDEYDPDSMFDNGSVPDIIYYIRIDNRVTGERIEEQLLADAYLELMTFDDVIEAAERVVPTRFISDRNLYKVSLLRNNIPIDGYERIFKDGFNFDFIHTLNIEGFSDGDTLLILCEVYEKPVLYRRR